jgi:hypothetical protein
LIFKSKTPDPFDFSVHCFDLCFQAFEHRLNRLYKPLLHREGHPGAAFFRKEDAVVTDLSSIAAGDIRRLTLAG